MNIIEKFAVTWFLIFVLGGIVDWFFENAGAEFAPLKKINVFIGTVSIVTFVTATFVAVMLRVWGWVL